MPPRVRRVPGPSLRDVTDRLQALVPSRPDVSAEPRPVVPEVERTLRPLGVHQVRVPMSQVIARVTPAQGERWWVATVLIPSVAVLAAMVMFSS